MTATLSGTLGVSLNTSYKNVQTRFTNKGDINTTYSDTISHGTASGLCNRHYSAQLSIATASSVTLDLQALTDVVGAALAFVKVKHIVIRPLAANANKVTMGAAAADQFNGPLAVSGGSGTPLPTMDLEAGDSYKFSKSATGWTVDGTHSDLKFANAGAGTCLVDIDIYGTDA